MKIYTENNWIVSNIDKRITNPLTNFEVSLKPYACTNHPFQIECDITAQKIQKDFNDRHLYLGLSGGIDSEFVCKVMLRTGINFTPLIVIFNGNESESEYAFKFCQKNNLEPNTLYIDDKQIAEIIYYDIFKKFNGIGTLAVASIAAGKYVMSKNGVLILAEHVIGDGKELIKDFNYHFSEYDFYVENIPFFCYSPAILCAMLETVDNNFVDWMTYKHMIFQCELRQKIRATYSNQVNNIIRQIYKEKPKVASKFYFGDKNSLLMLLHMKKLY